jgi:atypical dual specificity phosphatase
MLRPLSLPQEVSGKVYLSSMPGYNEDFRLDRDTIRAAGVDTVLCLTGLPEIEKNSPPYAEAIKAHLLPWQQTMLPMPDLGAADDRDAWLARVRDISDQVKGGSTVLIHCAAGIGRTGTAAVCLLMTLGMRRDDAWKAVLAAGSRPEANPQVGLIGWAADVLGR